MLEKLKTFFSNKTNAISAAIGWVAVLGIVGSIVNIALLNGYDVVEKTVKTKTTYTTVTETTAGNGGSLLDNLRESLTIDGSTGTGTSATYITNTTTTPGTSGYQSPATLAAKRIIRNHLSINPFDFDLNTLKLEFGVTDSSSFGRLNAHDIAVVYDPKTQMYYSYGTDAEIGVGLADTVLGIQVRKSKDLVNWEYVGHAISEAEAESIYILQNYNYNTSYANGQHSFWAPDVAVIYDEATGTYKYRMYFSCTETFGSQHSVIYVAESDNPASGFTLNRNGTDIVGLTVKAFGINKSDLVASGVSGETLSVVNETAYNQAQAIRKATEVVNSYGQSTYNSIDPSLCYEYAADDKTVTGTYLVYGSFFGGIQIRQIDPATGLTLGGSTDVAGTLLAKVNNTSNDVNGPEGSSILYYDGYYYLFLSYGDLYSTYDVRVGRATSITGPYYDYDGVALTTAKTVKDPSSKKNVAINSGTKLMCSYYFQSTVVGGYNVHGSGTWAFAGFIAPGHGTWFYDKDGNIMFAHHTREGGSKTTSSDGTVQYNNHYLVIRAMDFITSDEGVWPVFSPGWYDGEDINTAIPQSQLYGSWEYVVFTKGSTTPKMSNSLSINKDGTVNYGNVDGTWTYSAMTRELVVNLDTGVTLSAKVMAGWDIENSKETIFITGIDNEGIAHWAKKTYN